MALQAFRARDDATLKRGGVYTLDTATGEIFSMTRLASDPQPAPPPPPRDPPLPPPPQEVPVPAGAGNGTKHYRRTKEEVLRDNAAILWYLCDNPVKSALSISKQSGASYDSTRLHTILTRLERDGFLQSERKKAEAGVFTPTGMTVFWSVTEAGRIEARRLRAANSNGSTVRDLPHEGAPPDFPSPRS